MKRALAILFALLACTVGSLALLRNAPNRPIGRQAAAPPPTIALTPVPTPTIAPTPTPVPTPTPTPDGSHLLDGEEWYRQRNSDLATAAVVLQATAARELMGE